LNAWWSIGGGAALLAIAFVIGKIMARRERAFYRGIEVDPARPTNTISGNRIGK